MFRINFKKIYIPKGMLKYFYFFFFTWFECGSRDEQNQNDTLCCQMVWLILVFLVRVSVIWVLLTLHLGNYFRGIGSWNKVYNLTSNQGWFRLVKVHDVPDRRYQDRNRILFLESILISWNGCLLFGLFNGTFSPVDSINESICHRPLCPQLFIIEVFTN